MKIAIVGGGASGLIAAIILSKNGLYIDLYERNENLGKKIKASGNGHCNIFNTNVDESHYFGNNCSNFIKTVFKKFDFKTFKKICNDIGLFLQIKENGRVYPLSNESASVVELFLASLRNEYVNIINGTPINKIKNKDKKFYLFDNNNVFLDVYDTVILSTGSMAAYQINGECNGLNIASFLGHTINDPYPSLVPVECSNVYECKRMEGVKVYACIDVYINNKKKDEICGDLLFTKYGLSGFAILDISQTVSFALLNNERVFLSVNLLPNMEKGLFKNSLLKTAKRNGKLTIYEALLGYLPKKISKTLLSKLNITYQTPLSAVSLKTINNIAHMIFNWRFDISDTHGFKYSEASGGGVDTSEINATTMESRLIDNLYLTGELLDVVGKRGGYNLAFAFATGYISATNILRKSI